MKKKNDSEQRPGNEVGSLEGAEYCINFRVNIPFNIEDGGSKASDVSMITDHVLASLKAVKAKGVDVSLEHSTFVGTKPQNIPILPVVSDGC